MAKDDNVNPVEDTENEGGFSAVDYYKQSPGWAKTSAKVVLAILIVVGLVFAGRAIHHAVKSNNNGSSGQNIAQTNKKPQSGAGGSGSGAAVTPGGGAGASSGNTSGSNGSSAPAGSSSSLKSTQVPNTGPGNVAAIFAATSAAAGALHYVYRRKISDN